MSTKSRMSLPKEASQAAEPMLCNTILISPAAISSFEASLCALAKLEAVVSIGKPGRGVSTDIADDQVDVAHITLFGHCHHLRDVAGVEHDSGDSGQCASSDTDTTDVFHLIAVAADEGRTSAHRDNDGVVELRFELCPETVGHELLRLGGGQSVDGGVDIGCAYTGEHYLFHIFQVDVVVVQVFAERTIEGGDGVGSRDADGCCDLTILNTNNLCG